MNNKDTKITPLSNFPTEVILHFYRKNRLCYTDYREYIDHYNRKTNKREFWIPFYGPYERDGIEYKTCLGYTKSTGEECHKRFTTIESKQDTYYNWDDDYYYHGDEVNFRFEGLYWEGKIQDLKNELDKREHIGIFTNKDYRKWLIKYRKSIRN